MSESVYTYSKTIRLSEKRLNPVIEGRELCNIILTTKGASWLDEIALIEFYENVIEVIFHRDNVTHNIRIMEYIVNVIDNVMITYRFICDDEGDFERQKNLDGDYVFRRDI